MGIPIYSHISRIDMCLPEGYQFRSSTSCIKQGSEFTFSFFFLKSGTRLFGLGYDFTSIGNISHNRYSMCLPKGYQSQAFLV